MNIVEAVIMSFSSKIKELRIENNFTQQELADKLYVSRQSVCRWEKGTRCPDIFLAKKLANELYTTLDELIVEEDTNSFKREVMESQSFALDGMSVISQIFMIISLLKGEEVWKAFFAISLFGFSLICYKRWTYRLEKPWCICGAICLLLGIVMSVSFFMKL